MILKKPYAFLIKHFRIIHGFLLVFASYLILRTHNIFAILEKYIDSKQRITSIANDIDSIIVAPMYVVLFLIAIIIFTIIFLLRYKKKPILLYIISLAIYILVLISYIYATGFFDSLKLDTPDLRFVNILKDLYRVLVVFQIPIIAIFFIRMVGFDVRKFDFKKDLLDLGIDDKDNEEYEFSVELDRDTIQSFIKRKMRMIKYFYKENGLIFKIGEIALGTIILVFIIKIFVTKEVIYKEGQSFEINSYRAKIVETYKTSYDASGNKINSKYFYLITKINYTNITNTSYTLNTNKIMLSYEDELINPISDYNNKFTDFGIPYSGNTLNPYETRDFILIFEVPKEYYDSSFMINYLYDIKYKNNSTESEYKYKRVKINPKEFDSDKKTIDTKSLGEELSFDGSLLGNTKIKIYDIKMNDTFFYNVKKCKESICETRQNTVTARQTTKFDLTLMRIHFDINYDEEKLSKYYKNSKFIEQYGSIRFEVNGKEFNNRLTLTDVTPIATKDYVFIELREKVKLADKIYLDFTVRDKVYTYIIKDNTQEANKTE